MNLVNILDVVKIANKSVSRFSGVKKYIATGDLSENIITSYNEITYDMRPSRANVEVEIGQVIFARMKDTKKVLLIDDENVDFIYSTGFCVFEPKKEILSDYLRLILNSDLFQNQKDKYSKGATQKAINNTGLKNIQIPLPSLETQKKIVEVLDKAQSLIDAREEQIRLMDELILSVFYEMFGDPVTNPKAWKKNTIGSVVKSITAGWSANGEVRNRNEDEKAVLKVSAVTQGYFKEDEYKVINNSQKIKKYVFPEKGDLLFSRANTREMVGATCVIEKDYPYLLLPDKLWKVLFTKNADVYYMKYILTHPSVRAEFSAMSTGTSGSMYNVSMDKFKNILIPVPPIKIQNQFSQFVEFMIKKKMEMNESINEIQLCYHSLMQQSFKGEIFGGE